MSRRSTLAGSAGSATAFADSGTASVVKAYAAVKRSRVSRKCRLSSLGSPARDGARRLTQRLEHACTCATQRRLDLRCMMCVEFLVWGSTQEGMSHRPFSTRPTPWKQCDSDRGFSHVLPLSLGSNLI